jgi:hypothetical protein
MWDILDRLGPVGSTDIVLRPVPVVRSLTSLRRALAAGEDASKADLLHGQFGSLVGLLTALQRGNRRIVSLRGSDVYWRYGSLRNRFANFLRIGMSWIGCVRADAVVVMSHAMAARVRRWPFLRRRAIHVLVDPAGEMFWPEGARQLAGALRAQPFSVLIGSLVRDNPVKRLSIVAKAADLCAEAGMGVTMIAISGMSRDAVCDALAACDSVALASTHEGWPNIIKEALLLGKPFVATPVSDLPQFAPMGSGSKIVEANPLDFAFAWVDQIAAQLLAVHGISAEFAAFHPDVCALKHQLLYRAYAPSHA